MQKSSDRNFAGSGNRWWLVVLGMAMVLIPTYSGSGQAQTCLPVVSSPITVNGIVVGAAIVGGGLPAGCSPSPGWAGVVSQNFAVFGTPGTLQAKFFLVGYNATADATLDKIYLGVHVEGDPEIDLNDRLILYFDVDGAGGGTWSGSDFALAYEIGPAAPPSDESCNHDPGSEQFYRFSGGNWTPEAIPGGITRKASWDFCGTPMTCDPETGIWEFEIELDVAALGLTAPASGMGFRVGARLLVHQDGVSATTVFRWPSGLTGQTLAVFDPNYGNVTPANLERTTAGNCNFDVTFDPDPTSGVTSTSATGQSNSFTRLGDGDFDGQTPKKQNHFSAKVKFYNPANPFDNSPVAIPNTGQVRFYLKPWNGSFLGEYEMNGPFPLVFDHLGQTKTVTFDWPQTRNQYEDPVTHQPRNHLNGSSHTCLKVQLTSFTANANLGNDLSTRNLTYVSASTVRDTFTVSAAGMEPPPGSSVIDFVLRGGWQNLPPGQVSSTQSQSASGEPMPITRLPWYERLFWRETKWHFSFPDAARHGLKDLGNGYYSLQLKPGEERRIPVAIVGGTMPVTPNQYQLSPRAGGTLLAPQSGEPPLDLPVTEGKMITIVAHGLISVIPQDDRIRPNGPNGFSDPKWGKGKFLLPADYYTPDEQIGALIGSFDGFKTAFVIGTDLTFLVPQGASKLSLAINDTTGAYDDNTGKGFELNVIVSDPLFLPTKLASPGNPVLGIPARPRAGSNLPELDIDLYQMLPPQQGARVNSLQPTGYIAYAVYASHPEKVCACGQANAASLGFSTVVMVFGLALVWSRISRGRRNG